MQVSQTEVMLTDMRLNCICVLNRNREYAVLQSTIGRCGEKSDFVDGPYTEARFDKPKKIAGSPNKESIYITENKRVRKLSTKKQEVSTIIFPQNAVGLITALSVTE